MRHYERRLPHWDVVGEPLFITFRLQGSLPPTRLFPPVELATSGKAFRAMDRILDGALTGPVFLRQPEIAAMVESTLLEGASRFQRYQLHAFVVMPNHVHVLATPNLALARWLGPLKGFTGYQANQILRSPGRAFWQDESYDHLVRTRNEFERIRFYIEYNPVRAGVVAEAEEFPWSSAHQPKAA
jgi:putative DNA methylase